MSEDAIVKESATWKIRTLSNASLKSTNLDGVIDFIGDDNLVWNTDYPHPDAPDSNQVLPWFARSPFSDDSKRKIPWDNAVRLYGPRLLESAS